MLRLSWRRAAGDEDDPLERIACAVGFQAVGRERT